jgi:FAD/FMN-containing dehydrogenase
MTEILNSTKIIQLELDLRPLRAVLDGEVVGPGDADWDEARLAWNLAVDQRPAAVAVPESAEDVAAVVEFARAEGLRVAPQGTGHNAGTLGDLSDTILLKTHRMRGVTIDPEARIARAEAGVIWIEVVEAAAEHGLAALAGSSPDVGVVGYTLGGGLSWLARKHGIGANQVTAIEVVPPRGTSSAPTGRTSLTCSGRFAAAAARSRSSRRSSSTCSRSARSTPASSGTRWKRPPKY